MSMQPRVSYIEEKMNICLPCNDKKQPKKCKAAAKTGLGKRGQPRETLKKTMTKDVKTAEINNLDKIKKLAQDGCTWRGTLQVLHDI